MTGAPGVVARLAEAVAFHRAGRIAEAEAGYRAVLAADPQNGDALNLLGVLAGARGELEAALALFDRAIAAARSNPMAYFNRANLLVGCGRMAEALKSYRKAIALKPDYADARLNLGAALYAQGDAKAALQAFRAMIARCPDDERGHYNLGKALAETGDDDGARVALGKALALRPDYAAARVTLAKLHADADRLDLAVDEARRAVACAPKDPVAVANLATYLARQDAHEEAMALYDRALALKPDDPEALVNRGLLRLAHGRLKEGWADYAARARSDGSFKFRKLDLPWPQWRGEPIAGKRIFIWNEQGLGDEILHAGMIADVVARGAECVVGCSARLIGLLRRSLPQVQFEPLEDVLGNLQRWTFDRQIAALDLGQWCRPSFAAFPNRPAYLKADAGLVGELRSRYRARGEDKLLVGIAWRSLASHVGAQKTPPLDFWMPLLRDPAVRTVSLQYGPAELVQRDRAVFTQAGVDAPFVDDEIRLDGALDGPAAQIAAMDLVVTVSNTAAHLAGALGVPTWVLVPGGKARLWYWFAQGRYNPWYRSVRCVRWTEGQTLAPVWSSQSLTNA